MPKEMTKAARDRMNANRRKRSATKRADAKLAEQMAAGGESIVNFDRAVEEEQARIAHMRKMQKASPKRTTAARENLSEAFELMGGVAGLVVWGRENPTEFYRLWARLIPKESVEVSAQLPLEDLLKKLASKEELSVGEAAFEIGTELLEQGRRQAAEEDMGLPTADDTIN